MSLKFLAAWCPAVIAEMGKKPDMTDPNISRALTFSWTNHELTGQQFTAGIERGESFTALHSDNHRKRENFQASSFIALDFDKPNLELVDNHPLTLCASIRYETPNSTPLLPRFRLVWLLNEPITDRETYEAAIKSFMTFYGEGAGYDPACKDSARFFFGCKGSAATFTGNILPLSQVLEGVADIAAEEVQTAATDQVDPRDTAPKGKEKYLKKVLLGAEDKVRAAPKGTRHDTLIRIARMLGGYCAGEGLDEFEARRVLENAYSSHAGYDKVEMKKAIEAGLSYGKTSPITIPPPNTTGSNPSDTTSNTGSKNGSKNTNATEPPKPKLIHFDELAQLPPPEWLIKDQIQRNSFTMLVGESGSKKTFIALDYALTVGQSEPVIYVAAEGASGISQRIKAWETHYEHKKNQCYLWPGALQINDMESVLKFLNEAEAVRPSLIVFDTLARCAVGLDENSARDMGMFVENCDLIRRETGACVMVVHHTGKNGGAERGSSALRGACDTMLKVSVEGDLSKLTCDKQKDAQDFDPIFYKWVEVAGSLVPVLTTGDNLITNDRITGNNLKVLEVLAGAIFESTGANWRRLLEILEWENTSSKKSQLFKILNALKKKGYITQSDKGEPYTITAAGRDVLSPQPIEDIPSPKGW